MAVLIVSWDLQDSGLSKYSAQNVCSVLMTTHTSLPLLFELKWKKTFSVSTSSSWNGLQKFSAVLKQVQKSCANVLKLLERIHVHVLSFYAFLLMCDFTV